MNAIGTLKIPGIAAGIALTTLAVAGDNGARIEYPDGYRDWHHVKSMVIQPGHALENPFEGIHHVYANDAALAGLSTGSYPDGATLVFDLLQQQAADHAIAEGPRKLIGVMVRDDKAYATTGGWGFEAFAGDSRDERLVTDGGQGCFDCHQAAQPSAFVFAQLRD